MAKIKLFNSKSKITQSESEQFFNQYKLYHSSAETISDRRQTANNYMWTINAALISGFGLSFASNNNLHYFQIVLSILAIILCIFWHQLIVSYKNINSAKFKIIHELEKKLPINLYAYEWELIKTDEKQRHQTFSSIEVNIPIVFFSFWLCALVVLILPIAKIAFCSM